MQKQLLGGLALGNAATIQLAFRPCDTTQLRSATVKTRSGETETLPLFANKDSIGGEVRQCTCLLRAA